LPFSGKNLLGPFDVETPNMKSLAYLNKYFFKYIKMLLLGIVFVVVSNYFRVLQPRYIRYALDLVVENIGFYRLYDGYAAQGALYKLFGHTLLLFGGVVVVLALLMGVFMFFMRQTLIVMSRLIEQDLRDEIFAHYERLSLAFYKVNNTGDLMARITEDVSKIRMYLGPAIMYGINLVVLFVMVIYSMLSVNVALTIYSLLPLPILSASIYYISNLINKKSEAIQGQLSVLNSTAQETYSGIRVIKSYIQERPTSQHFAQQCEDYRTRSLGLVRTEAFFFPLMLALIGISTIIVVYVGGMEVANGSVTAGNIAEFIVYVNMLTWPVTSLGWVASIVQRAAASQKRINEFLQTDPSINNEGSRQPDILGDIVFDNVGLTYPDSGIRALDGVSFHLGQGQKMALIGRTGSGKSTLADLIVRLYDATEGEIRIDGLPIRQHDLGQLREAIGYVPQEVFLFSDSVAANIAFGVEDVPRATIEEFARHAAVYDDIQSLPKGFDTVVGERGVTLSGGQKQRISLARALIKSPRILLLDDCLSAVDTHTEQRILGYLKTAMHDRTTIIITHRIYALLNFDKIMVLDQGKVVEEGTHESLLAQKGFYYDLFEQQKLEDATVEEV
jgi:ATP-binding cassette subfamily B multidrug efflux pump